MNAVLAMDSYNRRTRVAMLVLGIRLGNYTYQDIDLPQGSDEVSFSATAYLSDWRSTVISYRGTDAWEVLADPRNGFPIGAGIPFGSQFLAAFEFYNAVSQTSSINGRRV